MYLKELSEISGISGQEKDVRAYISERIAPLADEIWTDPLGNLIAVKKGRKGDKRLLLAAHMDEVGMMVTRINDDGTLSVMPVGGLRPEVVVGKQVMVGDALIGVIGFKPIHLQKKDTEKIEWSNLRVYCGFANKEEAKENVKIGTYVSFVTKFSENGVFFSGKAFDDRGGCSVLMDVIESIDTPPFDTIFSFVVQEETGLRGSAVVAEQVKPDVAIVVETTTAGDVPELEKYRWATHLGDGPAITFMHRGYVVDPRIFERLVSLAQKAGIPFQYKMRTAGGTDAARFARSLYGVPSGVVSIPCRYIHSPLSVMHRDDYRYTAELIKHVVETGEVIL
ncbi:MAG: hypothetical protein PWP37_1177 [Thermotogota bacterium]|nr:hypothetical protein [Thermotogota bacterium]MDK2864985.1 hypothetical protein [Thermotogota bacterium]HCZ06562.1 peptidase M42 [Thermotogota bacterium]